MILSVGLTGGIACGKSTVAGIFSSLGCRIIDADILARRAVRVGSSGYRRVVDKFGPAVLQPDGELDRKALGSIVFGDREKRAMLNAIIHSRVKNLERRIRKAIARSRRPLIVITDAALMIEALTYTRYEKLIVVACDRELQIRRIMEREGISSEEADRKVAAQMDVTEKVALADYVVDNSGTLQETESRTVEIHQELKRLLAGKLPEREQRLNDIERRVSE